MMLLYVPLFLQGAAMAVDEFYFHHKRGLPLWERLGHPIDTFSVFLSLAFIAVFPYSGAHLLTYLALCAFSCFLITKDEFVHTELCDGGENWLHSVLFILHPLVFLGAGVIWAENLNPTFLVLQPVAIFFYMIYQLAYWNGPWAPRLIPEKIDNEVYDTLGDRWYTADDDPVALLRAESKTNTPWVIEKIRSQFPSRTDLQILDVGCGGGFLSNPLSLEKWAVTGVDLSAQSLEVARKNDRSGAVRYLVADAYRLPFPDASFEAVTAMDFLEHVEDPKRVIQEISRVLKPGGVFIFHTFNRNWLSGLVIIKAVEWLVKNTPKNLHQLKLFIKPSEMSAYCEHAQMKVENWIGSKPVFSTIPIANLFSGIVPSGLRFEFTSSLLLSYLGAAVKCGSPGKSTQVSKS